jgi:hypothetical protein
MRGDTSRGHHNVVVSRRVEYVRRTAEVGEAHREGTVGQAGGFRPEPIDPYRGERLVIRVSLEVSNGEAHITEQVQEENIERAVRLAITRHPSCEVRVLFPLDPETFFATGDAPPSGLAQS